MIDYYGIIDKSLSLFLFYLLSVTFKFIIISSQILWL